jgi:hypothetical protein
MAKAVVRRSVARGKAVKSERKSSLDRAKGATAGALIATVVTGVFGVISTVADHHLTPPTSDTVTVCTQAQQGVKKALDAGIDQPDLLDTINPEEVDRQCRKETVIACDILDGLNGQIPADKATVARRLSCHP